eukprot:1161210-Pelagomonas_calceolata.AAC.18
MPAWIGWTALEIGPRATCMDLEMPAWNFSHRSRVGQFCVCMPRTQALCRKIRETHGVVIYGFGPVLANISWSTLTWPNLQRKHSGNQVPASAPVSNKQG